MEDYMEESTLFKFITTELQDDSFYSSFKRNHDEFLESLVMAVKSQKNCSVIPITFYFPACFISSPLSREKSPDYVKTVGEVTEMKGRVTIQDIENIDFSNNAILFIKENSDTKATGYSFYPLNRLLKCNFDFELYSIFRNFDYIEQSILNKDENFEDSMYIAHKLLRLFNESGFLPAFGVTKMLSFKYMYVGEKAGFSSSKHWL